MAFTTNINYSQATGSNSNNGQVILYESRDPTASDTNYPIGKQWFNTVLNNFWILESFSTASGYPQAVWEQFGTSMEAITQYAVLVGGASSTIASIAPDASTTKILVSGGVAANPSWQSAGSIGVVTSFATDSGTAAPAAGVITFNANTQCGSSVKFSGSGSTVALNVTDASLNTFVGATSGNLTLSGDDNAGFSYASLTSLTSGSKNAAYGMVSQNKVTSGSYNTSSGAFSLQNLTTSNGNVAIGNQSLQQLVTGEYNTCIGYISGYNYTTNESSNILIGPFAGTVGDNNTIRIGASTGGGGAQINKAFIAGINGVTSSNPLITTINSSTDQLGVVASGIDGVLISSHTGIPSWIASGTDGYVLTANTGAPPSFKNVSVNALSVVVQIFTTTNSYFPTLNMKYCKVEVIGGGGGGGASSQSGVNIAGSAGGGGGSGSYAMGFYSAATIGAGQTATVGTGGAGGAGVGSAGATGGTSDLGGFIGTNGGLGGQGGVNGQSFYTYCQLGGNGGGNGSGGDVNIPGNAGGNSFVVVFGTLSASGGTGAGSYYGGSVLGSQLNTDSASAGVSQAGSGGANYGGGGGGAANLATTVSNPTFSVGGNGANGVVIITEFVGV